MKKWKNTFFQLSVDKKMRFIVTCAIVMTTLLILTVSTVSSVTSLKQRSVELLQEQNSTVAENFRSSLESYKTLAIATIMDNSVQQYAEMKAKDMEETMIYKENVYEILESINNMHQDLNFLALIEPDMTGYLFKGKTGITASGFLQAYFTDLQKCKRVHKSSIKMSFNNDFFRGKKYTLNVYYPIYDTEIIFKEWGLLCMNFTVPSLEQIVNGDSESTTELAVVDMEGMLIASKEREKIGQNVDYMENIETDFGTFVKGNQMYIFQKVKNWDFYVVSSVPLIEIFQSSIQTIAIMVVILVIILIICTRVISKIIRKTYRPLERVVEKMDDVAAGSLKTRISEENMGEDFRKLAVGFNLMMDEVLVLMEQVKEEQHRIEQIRFNALQEQIQPHFLYNTLECIHWQAMADGNREISTLVKALAKYYRICLNKGSDVISLKMELEHVQNYLIIQNMRYDDIIGCEFEVDESITNAMLPKISLQPLVENSIYHGMKVKEGKKGTVFISAKKDDGNILITVSDTGTGMEQEKIEEMNKQLAEYDDSFGYGVRNVNKRMELLYGKGYGLRFMQEEFGGVTVEIKIPYVTDVRENVLRGE